MPEAAEVVYLAACNVAPSIGYYCRMGIRLPAAIVAW